MNKIARFQKLVVNWPKSWEKEYLIKVVRDHGDSGFGYELFDNFIVAKSKYPELDPINGSEKFSFALDGGYYNNYTNFKANGKGILEFEEWSVYKEIFGK